MGASGDDCASPKQREITGVLALPAGTDVHLLVDDRQFSRLLRRGERCGAGLCGCAGACPSPRHSAHHACFPRRGKVIKAALPRLAMNGMERPRRLAAGPKHPHLVNKIHKRGR